MWSHDVACFDDQKGGSPVKRREQVPAMRSRKMEQAEAYIRRHKHDMKRRALGMTPESDSEQDRAELAQVRARAEQAVDQGTQTVAVQDSTLEKRTVPAQELCRLDSRAGRTGNSGHLAMVEVNEAVLLSENRRRGYHEAFKARHADYRAKFRQYKRTQRHVSGD